MPSLTMPVPYDHLPSARLVRVRRRLSLYTQCPNVVYPSLILPRPACRLWTLPTPIMPRQPSLFHLNSIRNWFLVIRGRGAARWWSSRSDETGRGRRRGQSAAARTSRMPISLRLELVFVHLQDTATCEVAQGRCLCYHTNVRPTKRWTVYR